MPYPPTKPVDWRLIKDAAQDTSMCSCCFWKPTDPDNAKLKFHHEVGCPGAARAGIVHRRDAAAAAKIAAAFTAKFPPRAPRDKTGDKVAQPPGARRVQTPDASPQAPPPSPKEAQPSDSNGYFDALASSSDDDDEAVYDDNYNSSESKVNDATSVYPSARRMSCLPAPPHTTANPITSKWNRKLVNRRQRASARRSVANFLTGKMKDMLSSPDASKACSVATRVPGVEE